MKLIGRQTEVRLLEKLFHSKKAEFLTLYGRRRVGKTYLIREFFSKQDNSLFFNVTGAQQGSLKEQLTHFTQQLGKIFYGGYSFPVPKNWDEALQLLNTGIEKEDKKKKIILFFDELPWMATRNSRLLQRLDYFWNQHWSSDPRIKLIVCGSSASWIIHKIIKNRGGLHNRITQKIRLEPFSLSETKLYLNELGIKLSDPHILQLYLLTGGVPYYLSHLKKGLSATQLIEDLAFTENGILREEFDNLFHSLFDEADDYIHLIKMIASKRYGIGQQELLKLMGSGSLGSAGKNRLEELEEAGFIISFIPYGHTRQGIYYRLIDEYTSFYLKWIEPSRKKLHAKSLSPGHGALLQHSTGWNSWAGYAFENVCYKHLSEIKQALSIGPDALADTWRYVPRAHSSEQGAQIDLLFDRSDDSITLCEIKYTDEPFILTKSFVESLHRKRAIFKSRTRTRKHIFTALISVNGVKDNYYAADQLSQIITLSDLFGGS